MIRSCYRSKWKFPGVGEVDGYYFFNDSAPIWEGENYFGSANWHRGDGTPWPTYGERDVAQQWRNGSFPIVKPDNRTVGPLNQISGDSPIDPATRPGLFGLPLLCWSIDVAITVKVKDNDPTYTGIAVVSFDQDDGFVVSQPESNTAQINLQDATYYVAGKVSAQAQSFGGRKTFIDRTTFKSSGSEAQIYAESNERNTRIEINAHNTSFTTPCSIDAYEDTVTGRHIRLEIGYSPSAVVGYGFLVRLSTHFADELTAYYAVSDGAGTIYSGITQDVNGLVIKGGLVTGGSVVITAADVSDFASAVTSVGNPLYAPIGSIYTDAMARAAVGGILVDSAEIDFTFDAGAPSITAVLKTTTVTPGTYPKVTVDSKGRITAGDSLAASDIPLFKDFPSGTISETDSIPYYDSSDDANKKADVLALVNLSLPAGIMALCGANTTPNGWLKCDGSAVSRTTYANLFAMIGVVWGTGDGSTTFNLPDLRGRTVVGAGTGSGLSARTVGQTGGTETHTLVTGEMPSHSHTPDLGSHFVVRNNGASAYAISTAGANIDTENCDATSNTGGGGAHNNMQPFGVLLWIIKY